MKILIIVACIIVFILLVLLFLVAPGNKNKCIDSDWLFKSLIAHRGIFNGEIKENSKEAFLQAIERKYNIETDVTLTKDEHLIVFHDNSLKRLYNVNSYVKELTLSEIKEISNGEILEFSELLDLIDSKVGLLIEIKNHYKPTTTCKKLVESLKDYSGKYVVQSFDPSIVRYFKKNYPMIPRGQLYNKFKLKEEWKNSKQKGFKGFTMLVGKFLYNIKFANCIGRPHFIVQDYKSVDFMVSVCKLFVPVIVFTIKDVSYYDLFVGKYKNMIIENLEVNKYGRAKKIVS